MVHLIYFLSSPLLAIASLGLKRMGCNYMCMCPCIYAAMFMYGHVWISIYEFLNCCLQSLGQSNRVTFNLSRSFINVYKMFIITKVCVDSGLSYQSAILLLSLPLYKVH